MCLRFKGSSGYQSGSALLVSLIILLIMTILGVQAMSTTTLEERMSGNYRDNELAFEAAEAALRAGEAWLDTHIIPPEPTTNGATNVWQYGTADYRDDAWLKANGIAVATNFSSGLLASQPTYVIEEQQRLSDDEEVGSNAQEPRRYFYRVVARGVGGSANAVVVLQTTYARLY